MVRPVRPSDPITGLRNDPRASIEILLRKRDRVRTSYERDHGIDVTARALHDAFLRLEAIERELLSRFPPEPEPAPVIGWQPKPGTLAGDVLATLQINPRPMMVHEVMEEVAALRPIEPTNPEVNRALRKLRRAGLAVRAKARNPGRGGGHVWAPAPRSSSRGP